MGTATPGGPGPAATNTPTPSAPPHALAWFQVDSHGVGQIWASINGATPHQITHMPVPSGECVRDQHWSPPVFSPDLTHIVAGWGSGACGDGPEQGDLYVIDAFTGATTVVMSGTNPANILLSRRNAGWIDNTHVWWIDGSKVYRYALGAASSTSLGTIASSSGSSYEFAQDAVLRGTVLFYVTASGSSSSLGGYLETHTLHRFDISTHAPVGGAISLGSSRVCECSRGDRSEPGFDVSADGAHIVYQKVTANADASSDGVASSKFYYANADGSGATRIASYATATSFVRMQLSHNGHLVAVTRALPAPAVFTASVTSPGASGDPNLHFYTPAGYSYPVWKWDNQTFWASTVEIPNVYPSSTGNLENYTVGTGSGSVGVAHGSNPWYTIGG